MVLIEMESDNSLLTLKWKDHLLTFPSFSGNTEDHLLGENSASSVHITTFLSLDVCEDNLVDWVFPLSVEETGFERSCLPLLPLANKKPRPLHLCWLLGKGPDRKGWLTGLTNWFIILGFFCSPVNIDLDFCFAVVVFQSCSSNFSPNK